VKLGETLVPFLITTVGLGEVNVKTLAGRRVKPRPEAVTAASSFVKVTVMSSGALSTFS